MRPLEFDAEIVMELCKGHGGVKEAINSNHYT